MYCSRCGEIIDGLCEGVVQVGIVQHVPRYHTSCYARMLSEVIEQDKQLFRDQLHTERLGRNTVETEKWQKQK